MSLGIGLASMVVCKHSKSEYEWMQKAGWTLLHHEEGMVKHFVNICQYKLHKIYFCCSAALFFPKDTYATLALDLQVWQFAKPSMSEYEWMLLPHFCCSFT